MKHLRVVWLSTAVYVATTFLLVACTTNPVNEAETFEQKAYALYGTYVIFQGKAAALNRDPAVPENVKEALRDADRVSYPMAETLVDAATTVSEIREIIDACPQQPEPDPQCVPTNQARLANAALHLSTIYYRAQPVLLDLVAVVKGAK